MGMEASPSNSNAQNASLSYRAPTRVANTFTRHPRHPANSPPAIARTKDHPIHYAFAQAFGERSTDAPTPVHVEEGDMISAVSFNADSQMVATGDKAGRVVILKRISSNQSPPVTNPQCMHFKHMTTGVPLPSLRTSTTAPSDHEELDPDRNYDDAGTITGVDPRTVPQYQIWTQFQSHESEFDYLKSMEIEEKINQIRWCRQAASAHRLISTNDKTIKVWRVGEDSVKVVSRMGPPQMAANASTAPTAVSLPESNHLTSLPSVLNGSNGHGVLKMPELRFVGRSVTALPRRVFSNAHAYHINSVSLNSDDETFLSSDDLRVHLWNMHVGGTGFNILDIKPENMENLTEVITSAQFHPSHCHLFMNSSSKGVVKLWDLRTSALCNNWAKKFEEVQNCSNRASFFAEIIASISDTKFSPDGRYILTRDYMNLRLWDMHMERAPILVIPVHEHLRSRLCDLYENDCIFDKFQCCFSSDGGSLLTGSYNALFQSYSADNGQGSAVEASIDYASGNSTKYKTSPGQSGNIIGSGPIGLADPTRRIMHLDSSTTEHVAAVAVGHAIYFYFGAGR